MTRLTIAEADAWEAAIAAAERVPRDMAAVMRKAVGNDTLPSSMLVRQNAAFAEQIADAIARLQPPRQIETGLCGRGA